MAAPSLGYAIGLNVKRKDIFKEAGENLGKNLQRFTEQQEKEKKDKKDAEIRTLDRAMKIGSEVLHPRYEQLRQESHNKMKGLVLGMLEAGADEADMIKTMMKYDDDYKILKFNSDNLIKDEDNFYRNNQYLKPKAADVVFGGNQQLTEDQLMELDAIGYQALPNGGFLASPVQTKPTAKTLTENKLDKDYLIAELATEASKKAEWDKAEKEKAKKDKTYKPVPYEQSVTETTYKQKKIPGYDPQAGTVMTPGETFFVKNIVNKMINEEAVVENALVEYERAGGSISKAMKDKMAADPSIDKDQAKAMVARDFIVENYYDSWAKENSAVLEANKTTKYSSGTSSKDKAKLPDVYNMPHLTTDGMKKAMTAGVPFDDAVNMPEYSSYIAGSGPTVSIPTNATEKFKVNIKGTPSYVNIDNIWIDGSGKYHAVYSQATSSASTPVDYELQDMVLSQSDMQSILSVSSAKDPLEALASQASAKGFKTPSQYAGVSSGATSGVNYGNK
jgi:hypothetical protein